MSWLQGGVLINVMAVTRSSHPSSRVRAYTMEMESTQSSCACVVGYRGPGSQEGGCGSAKVPSNAKGLVPRKGGAVVLRCL